MLIRSEALLTVGLLDERYFLYYEEVDLSVRLKGAGWHVMIAGRAKAAHVVSTATGGESSRLYWYYMTRNRLLFLHDHGRHGIAMSLLPTFGRSIHELCRTTRNSKSLTMAGRCISGTMAGYFDFFRGRFGGQVMPISQ